MGYKVQLRMGNNPSSTQTPATSAPEAAPEKPQMPPAVHQDDADEEDESVKQLGDCSSLYLSLQDCLVKTDRNRKACQKGENCRECNKYLWGVSQEKRKIHWVTWERLCTPKHQGGLGFRELGCFNDAPLAKQSLISEITRPKGTVLEGGNWKPDQGLWGAAVTLHTGSNNWGSKQT
ncbi:putative mitochondrial protein [Drosera capensis]